MSVLLWVGKFALQIISLALTACRLAISFEKRLKQDQRRVENTVELNTPSDIEKYFSDFFDGERLDACDDIELVLRSSEEIEENVHYPRLACLIFEVIIIHVAVNNLRSNLT